MLTIFILLFTENDPAIKENISSLLKDRVEFFIFILEHAILGKSNTIGQGSIICPGILITTNVTIGEYVIINTGTQIGHDVKIGTCSSLMSNIDIAGKCHIGKNVYIGTGTTVIPSHKIGDYAKVGAGSVVIRNVAEQISVFGNPGLKI